MRNVGKWLTYSTLGLVAALTLLGCAGGAINWNQEPPYSLTLAWGEKGSGPGQFNDPTGIAVTDTEVFISDARNGRIQVFDHQGQFRREFGAPGDGIGELGRPMNPARGVASLTRPEVLQWPMTVICLWRTFTITVCNI